MSNFYSKADDAGLSVREANLLHHNLFNAGYDMGAHARIKANNQVRKRNGNLYEFRKHDETRVTCECIVSRNTIKLIGRDYPELYEAGLELLREAAKVGAGLEYKL